MVVDKEAGFALLQQWIQSHATLPKKIDPLLVRRYLQSVRYDVEKAKKLLDISFAMRNSHADIFMRRDPTDKSSQKILQLTDMLPLPTPTKENYKVLLYRLADHNADEFNFNDAIKMFFMVADVRMKTPDPNGLTEGEIPIFDMAGFSVKHMTKLVLSTLRVYMKYTQEAHPVRPRQIHIINCSSFLDRILMLVKPFLKSEVFKLLHFHLPNSNTLDKFVCPDLMPNEYGGKAGDLRDLKCAITKQLSENREYLMDEDRWKTGKAKKDNTYRSQVETIHSFRALSID